MKNRQESIKALLIEKYPELAGRLFINELPASIPAGVLLKESYAGADIDPEIRGLRKARFQVAVRDVRENATQALALCDKIMAALDIPLETRTPDGIYIKHCRPLTEPVSYMVSQGNNVEFSMNFYIIYVV